MQKNLKGMLSLEILSNDNITLGLLIEYICSYIHYKIMFSKK